MEKIILRLAIHWNTMYLYTMYSPQLLKGTFQTIVLKLLTENKRMYGYEITQRVKQLSEGEIVLSEGSLYPILHKMEEEGLLVTEKVKIGNRVRRYYSITETGKSTAEDKLQEFASFVRTMKLILGSQFQV